ncbi:hypothetical protein F0562_014648 [Nyssa sinensis]|uniref:Very-long-chain aldehyde decarbonylase CER1-like C-terminal domain-containing protein n=1 Tax=Nyssa sinensis TaxID=561372 RepID=A0A5J4ZSM5_9ASTE|nr:hypothetical protein F0562_014648 [Nyssa sinensis]
MLTGTFTGTASIASFAVYLTYIDFMNNMGHCNFELVPKSLFSTFRPLKYLMYTPSFHSLHHTQFRTNYSLFMPIYDYIYEAEDRGIKVLSLGLLNQGEELNRNGELYIRRQPQLKVKVVDGSSLAVAVVLNSIPKGTTQVLLRGHLSKVAYSIALALCQMDIQVATLHKDEYYKLNARLGRDAGCNLVLSKGPSQRIWLVGDGLTEEEQLKASKGTLFIPFSQFPTKKMRKDCFYYNTPAMLTPKCLENVDSCENWLPRRVMSAWRIAGIVHALEGWDVHECGDMMFNIEKIWQASLQHGFHPLMMPQTPSLN